MRNAAQWWEAVARMYKGKDMFINITPKKMKDCNIHAVFEYQGVRYEERFEKTSQLASAVRRRKKDVFLHACDLNEMNVIYPADVARL